MRYGQIALFLVITLGAVQPGCAVADPPKLSWERLPDLPSTTGFAGAYAGVSHGALLVAGGTNFVASTADAKPVKTWYEGVYVLESSESEWRTGFKLPKPLAYGLSITTDKGLLCIGGCDQDKNYADVYLLKWNGQSVDVISLPTLPEPVSCAAGALVGDTVYVAGGQPGPDPFSGPSMRNFWSIDLDVDQPQWKTLDPWPGVERFYAVGASDGRSFYLISGLRKIDSEEGKPALEYLSDAYRYDEPTGDKAGGWTRIADLPRANAAAAHPAPVINGHILLLGNGADGANLDIPAAERPGFGNEILAYDLGQDTWRVAGQVPAGRAAVTAVRWNGLWILPTGEVRPMIRSPQVHAARLTR